MHVIPFDAYGGVETAALSLKQVTTPYFDFRVHVLFPGVLSEKLRCKSLNPLRWLGQALAIAASPPDVLIVSLWRAALVGLLCKFIKPQIKLVVFLHCAYRVHLLDNWANLLAMKVATEIWSDSNASLEATVPSEMREKCHVISYVPHKFEPVTAAEARPAFIFWGRLTRQKNILRSIRLFASIRKVYPNAAFMIVGPDGGEESSLRTLCRELELGSSVTFAGGKPHRELIELARDASFFLLTSEFEGLGLAVIEAMQLGLVPVVTNVGEVGHYCNHGVNALVIDSDCKFLPEISAAIENKEKFSLLRSQAIKTWSNSLSYKESVIEECTRIVRM